MGGNPSRIAGFSNWEYVPSRITDQTFHQTRAEINHLMKHHRLSEGSKKKKKVRFDSTPLPHDLQYLFIDPNSFQVNSLLSSLEDFLILVEYPPNQSRTFQSYLSCKSSRTISSGIKNVK